MPAVLRLIVLDPDKNKSTRQLGTAPAGRIADRRAASLRAVRAGLISRQQSR
jgi:hypothetical protein